MAERYTRGPQLGRVGNYCLGGGIYVELPHTRGVRAGLPRNFESVLGQNVLGHIEREKVDGLTRIQVKEHIHGTIQPLHQIIAYAKSSQDFLCLFDGRIHSPPVGVHRPAAADGNFSAATGLMINAYIDEHGALL